MHRGTQWVTISNALSLLRLVLAPVVVWFLLDQQWVAAFMIFLVASVTDLLDGYLARRFKEQTIVGQYLDPLADKVLLLSSFAALTYVHCATIALPWWFLLVVAVRELIIVAGGAVLVMYYPTSTVEPSFLGKLTTASYMFLIVWIFVCYFAGWLPCKTFLAVVTGVTSISLFSLFHYCYRSLCLVFYLR